MRVRSLGWEDPLEEEMATHSSVLAWSIPRTEEPVGCSPQGHRESDTPEVTQHTHVLHQPRGLSSSVSVTPASPLRQIRL